MKIFKKSLAFTLAEVLITIGVIGVVAAITLPSLITKSRKVMVENRLKDTYSILANATRLAEGEFGADIDPSEKITGNGFSSAKSKLVFDTYFRPFIKINYEYPQNECVELTKTYGANKSQSSMYVDSNGACYNLLNGVSIIFWAGRKDDTSPYVMPVIMKLQPAKNKSFDGIDTFGLQIESTDNGLVVSSGLSQIGADISDDNLVKQCGSSSGRVYFDGYAWSRSMFCFELIKRNGWKIPANYPLKF